MNSVSLIFFSFHEYVVTLFFVECDSDVVLIGFYVEGECFFSFFIVTLIYFRQDVLFDGLFVFEAL